MSDWEGFHYPAVGASDLLRELYLTSLGRISHAGGSAYPATGHPPEYQFRWKTGRSLGDFTLLWIERGRGELETATLGRQGLESGCVLLLAPGEWHRYRPNLKTGWVERWICVNGTYLHRLRAKGIFPTGSELRPLANPAALDHAFDTLRPQSIHNCLWVAGLALTAIALALGETRQPFEPAPTCGDALVDEAVQYIWTNCHRPLSVTAIARHTHTSRRMLERRFAAAWPRTIARELTRARVQRGKDLLQEKSLSVKEAGYAAGFGGARRFILAHRRIYGVTPGASRQDG